MKQLLTGKCLEDFEIWFVLNNKHITLSNRFYNEFMEFPISMQWGVILEFADSKGYHMTTYQMDHQNWFGYKITSVFILSEIIELNICRRKECMEKAIKHFNKLYNEKH